VALALSLCGPAAAHPQIEAQIAAVSRQISEEPADAQLYLRRGELRRLLADWQSAESDFAKAQILNPELAEVDLARGRMLADCGRTTDALAALTRFVARDPLSGEGFAERARIELALGRRFAAADDLTSAIHLSRHPAPALFLDRARALAAEGDARLADAARGLDEGLARLGPLPSLEIAAAELDERRGDIDSAEARLRRVLAVSPRKDSHLLRVAALRERAGRHGAAFDAYTSAAAAIGALPEHLSATTQTLEMRERVRGGLERTAPARESAR
jgi:tetratricopeptide (TPR) repeat protein